MLALLRRVVRLLDRRPRPEVLEDAETYRRAFKKAQEAMPNDPRMQRVIAEFERAEEAMRSKRG